MNINRVLLAKAPLTADSLIELLIGITEPCKNLIMRILPIHTKTGDFWLSNQDANFSLRKAFHSLGFLVIRVAASNLNGTSDSFGKALALLIQITPYKPLLIIRVSKFRRFRDSSGQTQSPRQSASG